MLRVLATGFPNSGTSFLLEFIKEATGLHAGRESNLKSGDNHNPYGYWEHLPVRALSWSLIDDMLDIKGLPGKPLPRNDKVASDILREAERDNVRIYKDNALPIVYRSFPDYAKIISIYRHPDSIYPRYYSEFMSEKAFRRAWRRYWNLNNLMSNEREVYTVFYEWFGYDTIFAMKTVCKYLGVPYREELQEVWRPRCGF